MSWFKKTKVEKRASDYTDLRLAADFAYASGESNNDPRGTSAIEIPAGIIARFHVAADVRPTLSWFGASWKYLIPHSLIRDGEIVCPIIGGPSGPMLTTCKSWRVVAGGEDEDTWIYEITTMTPSGTITRLIPSGGVCHFRHTTYPGRPWVGIPPWAFCGDTARIAAFSDRRLGEEASGPTSRLMSIPRDPAPTNGVDVLSALRSSLAKGGGGLKLLETTSGGWDAGKSQSPQKDWGQTRVGAMIQNEFVNLRSDSEIAIGVSCGLPRAFFTSADGSALREGYRELSHGTLVPLGRIISEEITKKFELDEPVVFDFSSNFSADLLGRARAFQSLVTGGMSIEKSASLAGLMVEDGE